MKYRHIEAEDFTAHEAFVAKYVTIRPRMDEAEGDES